MRSHTSPFCILESKLYDLENIELQIVGFRHTPEDGVVAGSAAALRSGATGLRRQGAAEASMASKFSAVVKWEQEQVARYPPRGSSFMAR